jgi:alpha-D-xyloside xylohydrolase
MFLEFAADASAYQADLQYMLGPYLLVVPVFNEEGRCRFYLPPGPWYDFWTNQRVDGPAHREVDVPLERMPLFVRGDSVLPLAPPMDYVGQKPWEPIGLDVRVNSEAAFAFPDPERTVDVRVERKGGEVLMTMGAARHAFEVRFLAPGRLRDVRFSGRASETGWEEIDGTTVVRLRTAGACSLRAEVA